jgi:hypothetical protein
MVARMGVQPERPRRLSLTKKQLHEEKGAALLALLGDITADGVLTDSEVLRLSDWLKTHHDDDIPSIAYLAHLVEAVVANGSIETEDRRNLQAAIEKVLPVSEREAARDARERVAHVVKGDSIPQPKISLNDLKRIKVEGHIELEPPEEASWRKDPMTERQYEFIRSKGASISRRATKGQASDLIGSLLNNRSISSRQQMVMRFWNRSLKANEGRREVMLWLDAFYEEDPDRKAAWELYKEEAEDNGLQGVPERVPVGVGHDYLTRIKNGGESAVPRFQKSRNRHGVLYYGLTIALASSLLVGFIFSYRIFLPNERMNIETPSRASNPIPATPVSKSSGADNGTVSAALVKTEAPLSKKQNQFYATRHIVMALQISAIIGGETNRASIDGHLVRQEDLIDRTFGIVVSRIDPETRSVTFVDSLGNVITRRLE